MKDGSPRAYNGTAYSLVGHKHVETDMSDYLSLRVRRATTVQAITATTATKIQFNVEDYDSAASYDNVTNYRFTSPFAQNFSVKASIYLSGTSIGLCEFSAANIQFWGTTDVPMVATDYLEIWAYLNTARNIAITNSFLSIHSC
jgi:hypothetical protein